MNKQKRKPLIAGNWKMNKTSIEALALTAQLLQLLPTESNVDIVVCPPFTALEAVSPMLAGTTVFLGAQNCHYEKSGAFTGEISTDMLLSVGCRYVILGHSERRAYFAETDETVNKRLFTALDSGLLPILCVGESLDQRNQGITQEWVSTQIRVALADIPVRSFAQLSIAYEPIWAIGTGLTATPAQAGEICSFIRTILAEEYGQLVADAVRILYGGSMNAKNAADLLAMEDIDGGLIGGAALQAEDFSAIITTATQ